MLASSSRGGGERRIRSPILASIEQSSHFGELFVDLLPLRREVLKGSIQNFGCELLCHVDRAFLRY
jgi:hypothetical protein